MTFEETFLFSLFFFKFYDITHSLEGMADFVHMNWVGNSWCIM